MVKITPKDIDPYDHKLLQTISDALEEASQGIMEDLLNDDTPTFDLIPAEDENNSVNIAQRIMLVAIAKNPTSWQLLSPQDFINLQNLFIKQPEDKIKLNDTYTAELETGLYGFVLANLLQQLEVNSKPCWKVTPKFLTILELDKSRN